MNDQARAELRELQARAYGRGGDIHDDPEALRRLEELQAELARLEAAESAAVDSPDADRLNAAETMAAVEGRAAAETTAVEGERESAGAEVADQGAGDGAITADEAADDSAAVAADEPLRRSRWRSWTPWLWIGSVLVAAGLAATWNLASAAFTLIAGDSGTRQVEVIGLDASFDGWQVVGPSDDQTGFHDFYGVTPIAAGGEWWGGDGEESCLILARTADIESGSENISGPFYTGCSAGPFRATVQFVVTPDFPDEFLEQFPEGEAMQFVLNGDRVSVFTGTD